MKAKREHRIPMSSSAVAVLRGARELSDGSALVFPGTKHGQPLSDMTLLKLVKGLGFNCDIHGFRTSFRTWVQERTDYPREVAEAALAHTVENKVEAAYARSDLFDKRRQMMESWAAFLAVAAPAIERMSE
jgi:integrase